MKRAVLYARYSSDLQTQNSIDAQLRACRDYCQRNQYSIVTEYCDEALSGRSDERPDFQRMIDAAKQKSFDVVVCHKIDRFSRDRYDHSHYKRILQRSGVKLEYADQRIDDSPEGGLTESLLIGLSEYYSKNLARETMKGLNERAYKGKFNGGIPPLGYEIKDDEYVINEKEAEAIRFIFTKYIEGWGLSRISQALNELGYSPKRGGRFGKGSLHDILRNEKYIGVYKFGRVRRTADGQRNSHKHDAEAITVAGAIPQIIDNETWEKCKQKNLENQIRPGSYSAKRTYLLTGLLKCKCGFNMVGHYSNARKKSWYICGQNTRKAKTCDCKMVECSKIESEVIEMLKETLLDTEKRQQLCDDINASVRTAAFELNGKANALDAELRGVRAKLARLLDALEEGLLGDTGKERIKLLNARERSLEHEIKQTATLLAAQKITPQQVAAFVSGHAEALNEKDPEKLRASIQALSQNISYDGHSVFVDIRVTSYLVPKAGLEPARHR